MAIASDLAGVIRDACQLELEFAGAVSSRAVTELQLLGVVVPCGGCDQATGGVGDRCREGLARGKDPATMAPAGGHAGGSIICCRPCGEGWCIAITTALPTGLTTAGWLPQT